MGDVIWMLEMQQKTLNDILEEIRLPEFEREARTYRKRAEESYRNGWYDDALEYFSEAEQRNKQDFAVLRSMATIYLYNLIDLSKALEYFRKAAKYAKPYDAQQTAEAHYFAGIVCGTQQQFKEASEHMREATELDPEFYEAWYMHASFAVMLGNAAIAKASLEKAVEGDARYWERAKDDYRALTVGGADPDSLRADVLNLLNELREHEGRKARQGLDNLKRAIDTAKKVGARELEYSGRKAVNDLEEKYSQDSFSVYRDLIPEAQKCHEDAFQIAEKTLEGRIADKRRTLTQHETEKSREIAELQAPIADLRHRKEMLEYHRPQWRTGLGCLLSATWFIFSCAMIAERDWTFGRTLDSWVIAPFIFIGAIRLIEETWHEIKVGSIERTIRAKEREIEPLKKRIEEEYRDKKMKIEQELRELETLLQKCRQRQYL